MKAPANLPKDDANYATPRRVYDAYMEILAPIESPSGGPVPSIWAKDLSSMVSKAIRREAGGTDIRRWKYWFHLASMSPFLMGFIEPRNSNFISFRITLDWFCKPVNLRKLREERFTQRLLDPQDAPWVRMAHAECIRLRAEVTNPDTFLNPTNPKNNASPQGAGAPESQRSLWA